MEIWAIDPEEAQIVADRARELFEYQYNQGVQKRYIEDATLSINCGNTRAVPYYRRYHGCTSAGIGLDFAFSLKHRRPHINNPIAVIF